MDTISKAEQARLEELARYDTLDSPTEAEFDQFTEFASRLCNTPAAIINLLDENRQWFKAVKGLPFTETTRETSFLCTHCRK